MSDGGFDLLQAQRRIFRSSLASSTRLVALAICDHWSREQPEPFPSVARLGEWTGLGRDAVMRAIAELSAASAVRVIVTKGRVNRYDVTPLLRLPVAKPDQSENTTGGETRPHQSQNPTGTGRKTRHEGTKRRNQPKEPTLALALPSEISNADPAKTKPKKPKAVETPLPADWKPTEAHEAYAKKHGLDLELEADALRGWAEGRTVVSWNGTFSTRLANQVKWNRERSHGPRRVPAPQQGVADEQAASTWGHDGPLLRAIENRGGE